MGTWMPFSADFAKEKPELIVPKELVLQHQIYFLPSSGFSRGRLKHDLGPSWSYCLGHLLFSHPQQHDMLRSSMRIFAQQALPRGCSLFLGLSASSRGYL
jgi:hypothetical protein